METNNTPFVSVVCIAYNHEAFISQAIEGVLMQKTSFPIELIIGEDCSTDRTREICKTYKEKHPEIIKLMLPEKNLGMMPNFIATLQEGKGKYIAICEGDDYWTDQLKLQKQVDFMEANKDFVACGHETLVICYLTEPPNQITVTNWLGIKQKNIYTGEEFITSAYPFHTSAIVFRNEIIFDKKVQEIFLGAFLGDRTLYAFLGNLGKVYFFDETMSVYNMRNSGIAATLHGNTLINNFKNIIKTHKKIDSYFNKKNNTAFNESNLKHFDKMMFNKSFYQSKFLLIWDCLIFIFTGRYGKKSFIKKVKYIIKTL